jgi:hypothetical protein
MNLLTNGFVNNCGSLFGPSEQIEADIVRVGNTSPLHLAMHNA